jgi:hypothetical protein
MVGRAGLPSRNEPFAYRISSLDGQPLRRPTETNGGDGVGGAMISSPLHTFKLIMEDADFRILVHIPFQMTLTTDSTTVI